GHFATIGAI
ncbi:hypothetical protein D046_4900B, partial [Vibrio parahaemolyticus V-223/04]